MGAASFSGFIQAPGGAGCSHVKACGCLLLTGSWNPGDPQYRHCQRETSGGWDSGVFLGQCVGGFSPHLFQPTFIECLLSTRRSAGAKWAETPVGGWGLLGVSTPTLWAPGALAGELGLLWECVLATITPAVCVLSFMPPVKRWSNAVCSSWADLQRQRPRTSAEAPTSWAPLC